MKKDTDKGLLSQADSIETADEFRSWMRGKARTAFYQLVEAEVRELCGEHYHPDEEASCHRAGSSPSSMYINGAREAMTRPRLQRE